MRNETPGRGEGSEEGRGSEGSEGGLEWRESDDSEEVTEVRCVVFETTYQQFLL